MALSQVGCWKLEIQYKTKKISRGGLKDRGGEKIRMEWNLGGKKKLVMLVFGDCSNKSSEAVSHHSCRRTPPRASRDRQLPVPAGKRIRAKCTG